MEPRRTPQQEVERLYRTHFRRLTALAYNIIGQWQSAEDVAEEALSRLLVQAPEKPAEWLTTVTTRLALDVARSAAHQRTEYVGQWLPEIAAGELQHPDIDLAVTRLLQLLPPLDRAALVLVDVAGYSAAESAPVLRSTPAAVRKRLSRARELLRSHQGNHGDPENSGTASISEIDPKHVEELSHLLATGELKQFVDAISEGAVLWVDSGGTASAARNPIVGRDKIYRFLAGLFSKYGYPQFRIATHTAGVMLVAESADMERWVIFEGTAGSTVTGIQVQQNEAKRIEHLTAPCLAGHYAWDLTKNPREADAPMQRENINTEQLLADKAEITAAYEELQGAGLNLDLTRGKPSSEQLDFSTELLSLPGDNFISPSGLDVRNYGVLNGLSELRSLWGNLLGIPADQVIAGDASSLNIMFDLISWSYTFGNNDSPMPWSVEEEVKWICPVPGYDRHHSITELFGFEMLTVPMTSTGPDMDAVRELAKDPAVKGMWTVPIFANPTGVTITREVAQQLAEMETGAPDFRIVWDNAYAVHTLTDEFPEVINVLELAEQAGNPNRFWFMSSTSKITLAGAGVAFFASSKANLDWYGKIANIRGIGPNKVNQLAHLQFFGDDEGVRAIMRKHAGSLAPKFTRVIEILQRRLRQYNVAEWTEPEGGYFISVDLLEGTASRVVELAKEAGVSLTAAGATFPLKQDPQDSNLRLAPSMPTIDQLEVAMNGFATCVLLAAIEKLESDAS